MLFALATAFLGGVILNLMPCVFPVISLKALGLLRHSESPGAARAEGVAFLAGVVVAMLALAGVLLAARAGGAAIGWGFQLQSPVVIAVLALVILGSALNLFGLFEVGTSIQRVGEVGGDKGGLVGSALTGVLAIVVATPCTAPFMAGAVGYALVQPPWVALSIFLSLAFGFAAPFTLVSFVPGLARVLPRPGAWMIVVKRGLAFPMLGAAAWLAWVLDRQAGADALATLLACAVVLGLAAWLYGMVQQRQFEGKPYKLFLAVTAAVLVLAVAPLANLAKIAASPQPAAPVVASAPVAWSPQAVVANRGKGKAIFVNFTASWCITCQVNDKAALSTPAVKAALARTGTLYMIADSTKYNPDIEEAISTFGRGGLPVYVVYPADGGAPVVLPQLLSPGLVVSALDQAAGKKG